MGFSIVTLANVDNKDDNAVSNELCRAVYLNGLT